ncbi:MAG TPA: phage holin family protein [Rhodocyclaceae bacterium]|nr:phage holin family protein [Rhodocyclaceae bacterium]
MPDSSPRGGLLASLRGLAATGIELLQTRLELFAVELQEEKARLLGLVAFGAAALLLLAAGAVFLAVFLTVLLWDNNRLLALGIFSALFLGGGLVCLSIARHHARASSHLFAASLAELAKDRAAVADDAEPGAQR